MNIIFSRQLQASRSEESAEDSDSAKFQTTPHMINLNEDNMLSGVIKHCLKEGNNVNIDQTLYQNSYDTKSYLQYMSVKSHLSLE